MQKRSARDGEIAVNGICNGEGNFRICELLNTLFKDFRHFAKVYEIGGNAYPVRLKMTKTEVLESCTAKVAENEFVIESADTERIRKAVIYIEDEI